MQPNWPRRPLISILVMPVGRDETKVLLALSHDEYKWRTKERIAKSTGIGPGQVDSVLSQLIEKDKVRLSMSKKKNVIFGLRERVG